jgi:hypothetical protein
MITSLGIDAIVQPRTGQDSAVLLAADLAPMPSQSGVLA